MFEIQRSVGLKRIAKLQTKSGVVNTPFFMPIATRGAVKMISPEEIKKIGFEVVLGNTYHLWLKPGDSLVKAGGGLHNFMGWDGAILTDSGGFQVFSLGARAEERFGQSSVKIVEKGVNFTDPITGDRHLLTPEKSIDIQLNLGSDIIMCLDECPPFPCDYDYAKKSLERTTRWAERCLVYFQKQIKEKTNSYSKARPLIFCIVQGSVYEDLRQESVKQLIEVGKNFGGWDGFAIGGVAVGEPREKLQEILKWTLPLLPQDKPRYLMGLGRPEELVMAVNAGVDMFDCVIPTREGRHGRLFVWQDDFKNQAGPLKTDDPFYKQVNILKEEHKNDFTALCETCPCDFCQKFSKAYVRHLFSIKEVLGLKLAALHNLNFYFELIRHLREKD